MLFLCIGSVCFHFRELLFLRDLRVFAGEDHFVGIYVVIDDVVRYFAGDSVDEAVNFTVLIFW